MIETVRPVSKDMETWLQDALNVTVILEQSMDVATPYLVNAPVKVEFQEFAVIDVLSIITDYQKLDARVSRILKLMVYVLKNYL